MFYSQDILQRRGGKFGIIWIAATHPKRLTRRDYARVNVKKTSEALMDFILVHVPPHKPGSHSPRLSLYLSAQLMYGVTRCHYKQVEFLLGDVVDFLGRIRLLAATSSTRDIDLKASLRNDLVTEMDLAAVSGIRDVAFDPYFGSFSKEDLTIQLTDVEEWRVSSVLDQSSSSSRMLDVELPTTPKLKKDLMEESFKPVGGSPHTVSSPDDIKMKEMLHQIPDIEIPGIKELPGLDGEDLKLPDAPPEADTLLEQLLSPRRKRTLVSEIEPLLPEEKTPTVRPEEGVPQPCRALASPGVTPAPEKRIRKKRWSLTMELTPVTPSPVRRRRRKQLLFADTETQIPKKKIREQLLTGSDTCMPFILPDPKPSTVEDLFRCPGGKALMHPKLFPLWKRNATVGEISETESEKNTPIWTVPELSTDRSIIEIDLMGSPPRKEPRLDEEQSVVALEGSMEITRAAELSDIEVKRTRSHTSMEGIHRAGDTPVSMEMPHSTSRDRSLGDQSIDKLEESLKLHPGREMPSSEDEVNLEVHVQESVSMSELGSLYVVPEEMEDVLSPTLARVLEMSHIGTSKEVLSLISSKMESAPVVTFRDICPTSNTRPYAAHMFTELLELCKTCQVSVRQEEQFGDIFISRGTEWETT